MSISIDAARCRHCGRCAEACPGNLIKRSADGTAVLRRPQDCWACASCMKECAFGAISLSIGADAGGMGGRMYVQSEGELCHWIIRDRAGRETVITVDRRDANKY